MEDASTIAGGRSLVGRARVAPFLGDGCGVRLLCLPYAGASVQIFRNWCQWLGPAVEVLLIELPGRGLLVRQPAVERMEALVSALAAAVEPWLDKPLALFGHGMGGLVAFELGRRLQATGRPLPKHLFVSGQRAPQLPLSREPSHRLPTDLFIATVQARRGIPPVDLAGNALADFLLPALRGDFKLVEEYEYRPEPECDLPMTIFGGIEDRSVTREDLEAWALLTRQPCVLRWLPGNHFFVHEHQRLLAANVLRSLGMPIVPDSSPRALETLGFVTA
jgi:medium-chain acyl-[acyl-carrier-protein] hydrolase